MNQGRHFARTRLLIGAFLLAVAALSPPVAKEAWAQIPCTDSYERAIDFLQRQHRERLAWRGVNSAGSLVEVWQSKRGSWTVLAVEPGGRTCVISVGDGAVQFIWKPPAEGA